MRGSLFLAVLLCLVLAQGSARGQDSSSQSGALRAKCVAGLALSAGHGNASKLRFKPGILLLELPLLFYKKVLSEQFSASCPYSPSCSSFCMHSLDSLGVMKGLFLTADRLTRCNGYPEEASQPYLINNETSKITDSPGQYKLRGR